MQQLGPSRQHGPEARILTADSEQNDIPPQPEDRSQIPEIAELSTNGFASPEPPVKLAERKLGRTVSDTSARSRLRDLTFGDSAKAMVDEAIWNMATGDCETYRSALQRGQSAAEAAQAAGGQLAVIHQKINDYALKLEVVLSESKATINVSETIDKPLEQAMLEIIGNCGVSDLEKDAAIQRLGAVQEWVKHGRQKDMTPLQANKIMLAIGDRLNWGGNTDVSEEGRSVYRTLYANLKTAIRACVPEALSLHDRLTNLYAAKFELDRELLSPNEVTQALR